MQNFDESSENSYHSQFGPCLMDSSDLEGKTSCHDIFSTFLKGLLKWLANLNSDNGNHWKITLLL